MTRRADERQLHEVKAELHRVNKQIQEYGSFEDMPIKTGKRYVRLCDERNILKWRLGDDS